MRYFLEIAYNGQNYSGWQVQPNANTLQLEINTALSTALLQKLFCVGCGRTDAGVHAKQFYLHFDCNKPVPKNFIFKMNRLLPKNIAVKNIMEVESTAHSRFDATQRTYIYRMHFKKDPFLQGSSYYYTYSFPDVNKMQEASHMLLSLKDFKSLCKTGGGSKTTICNLTESSWNLQKPYEQLTYTISADRFLRGMVRMTVGVLLMIGRDKLSIKELKQVLKNKERLKYIMPVPAHGLYLESVKYPYI